MLVRGVLAAAVGTVLHHTAFDKKGKSTAPTMLPGGTRKNYGTAQAGLPLRRASTLSESRSGERLDSVPENVGDIFSEADGERNSWNDDEDGCSSVDDEDHDVSRHNYWRTWRLYTILPIGSLLFLVFTALLPEIIAPDSRPSPPPAGRLFLALILSASLWCLGHSVRVPLFNVLNSTLSSVVSLCLSWTSRRTKRHPAAAYIATFTSVIHALAMVFLQESLRIASFAILDLHWRQFGGAPSPEPHYRARDAAFREVWALAFGWALAEVCAGVIQGYEQLTLYADSDSSRRPSESSSKSGNEATLDNGGNTRAATAPGFDEEAADLVRWSMPCVDLGDDDVVEGVKTMTLVEIDSALLKLVNVRARDELEDLYGQPYIEIPVFVILLQRLDSILLSLGNTLLLAAAYLPKPPHVTTSLFFPPPDHDFPSLTQGQPASHTHVLPLLPTFFIVALVHTALGLLHSPPTLAKLGLPAAAYTSCIVGLGLTFAGIGAWIGLW